MDNVYMYANLSSFVVGIVNSSSLVDLRQNKDCHPSLGKHILNIFMSLKLA